MYKNKEGFPDPTAGAAVRSVRKMEKLIELEKEHKVKIGDRLKISIDLPWRDTSRKYIERVKVVGMTEHYIRVILCSSGLAICMKWTEFEGGRID